MISKKINEFITVIVIPFPNPLFIIYWKFMNLQLSFSFLSFILKLFFLQITALK